MAECTVCGRETAVSDACPHCAAPVCAAHRTPGAHDCPGVDGDATTGWYTDPEAVQEREGTSQAVHDSESPAYVHARQVSEPRQLVAGVFAVALVAAVGVGALAATGPPPLDLNETAVERAVGAATNAERMERGLAPLASDERLAAVAENHSRDMLARDYFDHVSPDGETLADRYERAGIDCYGDENIYTGANADRFVNEEAVADGIVRSLMESAGHREAILDPENERQGLGVAIGPGGRIYVTQDFC